MHTSQSEEVFDEYIADKNRKIDEYFAIWKEKFRVEYNIIAVLYNGVIIRIKN